jgi:hypothetical protein
VIGLRIELMESAVLAAVSILVVFKALAGRAPECRGAARGRWVRPAAS